MIAPRILLVEDEPIIRMLTAEILRDAGLEVTEAWNGDEVAQSLDGPEPFDMLMTDIQTLCWRGGIAIVVYARSKQPCIPVLVVSGYARHLTGRLAILAPVVFLPKSYKMAEVISVSGTLTLVA